MDTPTLLDQAIAQVGNDGVVIIRPNGAVETVDLNPKHRKARVTRVSNRKPRIPSASNELVWGYVEAAQKAEVRRQQSRVCRDRIEEKAWAKIARYCWVMAEYGFVDAPDFRGVFLPLDDNILNRYLLTEIMDDAEVGKSRTWTNYHQMALDAALWMLSNRERDAARYYYAAQCTVEEIAEYLGVKPKTVKRFIDNTRKKWSALRADNA